MIREFEEISDFCNQLTWSSLSTQSRAPNKPLNSGADHHRSDLWRGTRIKPSVILDLPSIPNLSLLLSTTASSPEHELEHQQRVSRTPPAKVGYNLTSLWNMDAKLRRLQKEIAGMRPNPTSEPIVC